MPTISRKVLVAEDHPATCDILETIFQFEGHRVFPVKDV
jgi:hypothetical protein